MTSKRHGLMIGGVVFGQGHHPRLNQLGAAFHFTEHASRRIFIVAAGRDFANEPFTVSKVRGVGC
ncbi:MAG: hypothetical protein FD138_4291 [Planctomycetota bacterium]|nr:MAG: hypothetical protein FD138_4291 [Planctomycetota bacterium]